MQKEPIHKSFPSGCEMKGPSEPAAHIVLIERQLNMDSVVGNTDKYTHMWFLKLQYAQ